MPSKSSKKTRKSKKTKKKKTKRSCPRRNGIGGYRNYYSPYPEVCRYPCEKRGYRRYWSTCGIPKYARVDKIPDKLKKTPTKKKKSKAKPSQKKTKKNSAVDTGTDNPINYLTDIFRDV